MITKKMFLATIALTLAFAIGLVGCAGSATSASSNANKATEAPAKEDSSTETAKPSGESSLKNKRVRVVIGSTSTSGDSYMIADMATRYLSKEMGFNGKVDAIGNARALEEISKAKGDGTTIMMFHDMIFLSVLFGAVDKKYALENLTVGPRIGQNPGACFGVKADAPYDNLVEMADWLKENPDKKVRINIEAGGASHLAFAAFYTWAQENYDPSVIERIQVMVGGSTAEKLQVLWDGNADVIFGDYSAFIQYTEDGVDDQLKMKIMDPVDKIEGVDILTMAENGVTFEGEPFVFSKDFAMYFPKDMDPDILDEIETAMLRVAKNPEFKEEMAKLKYKTVEKCTIAESQGYILGKRELSGRLIDQSPDLDQITVR